jgi:hypothetical protein
MRVVANCILSLLSLGLACLGIWGVFEPYSLATGVGTFVLSTLCFAAGILGFSIVFVTYEYLSRPWVMLLMLSHIMVMGSGTVVIASALVKAIVSNW